MKIYELGLKHDNGKARIRVQAANIREAKNLVMEIEKCPESAITWISIVPTQKQIQKTKSLLRGI